MSTHDLRDVLTAVWALRWVITFTIVAGISACAAVGREQ